MNQEQTQKQTNNRGGHRPNAGRKPSGTRKQPLTLYINENLMTGDGKNNLRNYIYETLKSYKNEQ
jgi:hypothetical protein